MKKTISLILVMSVLTTVFALCGVTAFAENDILDYLTYEIIDGEVTITDCDESISGDIVIPEFIDGYPVVQLGESAFLDCDEIVSVTFPEGLEIIDYKVFKNCSNLSSVNFPTTLKRIGSGAFECCISLEKVVVPDNVILEFKVFQGCTSLIEAEIGKNSGGSDSLFQDCVNLETVKINSVVLSSDTFLGCRSLKNVKIGDNVKTICSTAFGFCYALEEIFIPVNVSEIELNSFQACTNLKKIVVDENNPVYASENGLLLNKDKTKLIIIPIGISSSFVIPDSVTTIGTETYYLIVDAEIDLTGIEVVEPFAYCYCFEQEELIIPESVNCINTIAFLSCNFLKDVYIYNPDVQLDEMCLGFSDFKVIAEKDAFIEIAKNTFFEYDEEKSAYWYEQYESSLIFYDDFIPSEILTIHGYKGSTAQVYAETYGFKFEPICDHFNKETINAVDSDCENDGYTGDVYCYDCEKIIEEGKIIPSTGHNYVENIITEATYTQDGLKNSVCENCGDATAEVKIPMLEIEDGNEEKDEDTGVSVIFPDGTFDEDAQIEVTPVEEGEAYKLISHKEGNFKVTMFDINVTVDGQKVQPNGTVLVQIPLPKGYNQNKCVVYYVADDGTMEELKTYHLKDGYVYFETDHFSYYAVVEDVEETVDKEQWMDESLSFIDKIIAFFNMIMNFFKKLFGTV